MKLSPGDTVGSYSIEALIGFGAMGYVYGARHRELNRAVAIKALPQGLAADRLTLDRFRREALSASRLSHPHICTVYDFITDQRGSFIVMEFLDGETLADRLAKGAMDWASIVSIALEIANGMAHAHGKGIIHRDLKPANVMLTTAGAKILDFGLAKDALHSGTATAGEHGSASTAQHTTTGVILGTLPYMAPEQLVGGAVDARADIYALGVIIYEMLAGRRPYVGATAEALVHAVLTQQPDPFESIPKGVPPKLVSITRRCMAFNTADRYGSAAEVADALRSVSTGGRPATRRATTRDWTRIGRIALVGGSAVVLAVLAGVVYSELRAPQAGTETYAFDLQPPPGVKLTEGLNDVALSPDGRFVLFSGTDSIGNARLWIRPVKTPDATVVPNTDAAHTPFWSPDNTRLGYFARGFMWISDATGSRPQQLAPISVEVRGASWGKLGDIIYSPSPNQGLLRLSLKTGAIDTLTRPDRAAGQIGHLWPHFLPDGKHFLYFAAADRDSARGIFIASLDNPRARKLTQASGNALFADGHLLYYRNGDVYAQAFRLSTNALSGRPIALLRNVAAAFTYQASLSVSNTGILIYAAGSNKTQSRLASLDATGGVAAFHSPPQHQRNPAVSFDGTRIAVELYQGTDSDIEVRDLVSGRAQPLTDPNTQALFPVWAPVGYQLAYVAEEAMGWGIYVWDPDSGAPPRRVFLSPLAIQTTDWAPGGEIIFSRRNARGDYDVLALPMRADTPVAILAGDRQEGAADVSPAGDRIAYVSNATGAFHIFVQDYPVSGPRCQVSVVGGFQPVWSTADSALFFLDPAGRLMSTEAPRGSQCSRALPVQQRFPPLDNPATARNHFVVNPRDGTRILNLADYSPKPAAISVIVNWRSLISAQ